MNSLDQARGETTLKIAYLYPIRKNYSQHLNTGTQKTDHWKNQTIWFPSSNG
jgi:hypothetical protein